ncbi:unnamed protein product [Amoebophrya sp. A25]|nr:unnamed protein product [Amoebophrya sp. A25]|eukprot:GSA25T00012098001.1
MDRSNMRNMTVAVAGRQFNPLEQDESVLRKGERSNTLPTSFRRGDVEIKAEDLKELEQRQQALKGRQRRGSITLSKVEEKDMGQFWEDCGQIELHMHGKLGSENIPGAEREAVLYKLKEPKLLQEKFKFIYSCVKGSKGYNDNSPNQDNFSYTVFNGWDIIIVMDGHGPCGHRVSARCVETIAYYICKSAKWGKDMKGCIREAFAKSSEDLLGYAIDQDIDVQASGSTCVMYMQNGNSFFLVRLTGHFSSAMISQIPMHESGDILSSRFPYGLVIVANFLAFTNNHSNLGKTPFAPGDTYYTANVGDSRAIIGYENEKDVVFETMDHKPSSPEEKKRIEASGGEIRTLRYDDFSVDRIFVKGYDYPGLCMSRSFGDECVKPCGVTSEPEISGPTKIDLSRKPFLVIASDGVWEFIESAWCIKAIVKKLSQEPAERIMQKLSKEARRRWKQEDYEHYLSSITILDPSPPSSPFPVAFSDVPLGWVYYYYFYSYYYHYCCCWAVIDFGRSLHVMALLGD